MLGAHNKAKGRCGLTLGAVFASPHVGACLRVLIQGSPQRKTAWVGGLQHRVLTTQLLGCRFVPPVPVQHRAIDQGSQRSADACQATDCLHREILKDVLLQRKTQAWICQLDAGLPVANTQNFCWAPLHKSCSKTNPLFDRLIA